MIFNVAGLLSGTLGDSRQHKIENEQLMVEDRLLTHINGPIHLIRTDRTVILDADITAVTQAICSRCLEVATVNINVQMNEEFYPLNIDLMDQCYGIETHDNFYDDPALIIDKQNFLDLTMGLGQALIAAIPIAPKSIYCANPDATQMYKQTPQRESHLHLRVQGPEVRQKYRD